MNPMIKSVKINPSQK